MIAMCLSPLDCEAAQCSLLNKAAAIQKTGTKGKRQKRLRFARGLARVLREASVLAALPFGTDSDKQGPQNPRGALGLRLERRSGRRGLSKGNDSGGACGWQSVVRSRR